MKFQIYKLCDLASIATGCVEHDTLTKKAAQMLLYIVFNNKPSAVLQTREKKKQQRAFWNEDILAQN